MDEQKNRKVRIIETSYDSKRDLVKLTIKDLVENKNCCLAFPGEELSSFLSQIININTNIPVEHRESISKKLIGIEFNHIMKSEMKMDQIKDFKDPSTEQMKNFHDIIDKYPYKKVLESMEEEEND